jgi:hypothetical protein
MEKLWMILGSLWSWSYGSWIYNYLWNHCLSPLMLWVQILLRLVYSMQHYVIVCQWLAAGQWFSPGTPVSSTNITEILLKKVLNTITLTLFLLYFFSFKAFKCAHSIFFPNKHMLTSFLHVLILHIKFFSQFGHYNLLGVMDRSINCHMTLCAMSDLLNIAPHNSIMLHTQLVQYDILLETIFLTISAIYI